jgi:hypothetical protein
MNNAANLGFYTQLIQFQMNPALEEILFQSPDPSQQRTIQSWAHALGFEFEYSLASRAGRVVRVTLPTASLSNVLDDLTTFESHSSALDNGISDVVPEATPFLGLYEFGDTTDLNHFGDMFPSLGSVSRSPEHLPGNVPQSGVKPYDTSDKATQTDSYSASYRPLPPPPFVPPYQSNFIPGKEYPPSYRLPPPPCAPSYQSDFIPGKSSVTSTKRKAVRATQACDSCRSMKAKCDEMRPKCTFCNEKYLNCHYRDSNPKKQNVERTGKELRIIETGLFILGSILGCKMVGVLEEDLKTLSQGVLSGIQKDAALGQVVNVVYDRMLSTLEFLCITCKRQLTLQDLLLNPRTSCSTCCGILANPYQKDFPEKKCDFFSQVTDSRQHGESSDKKLVKLLMTDSDPG